MAEDEQPQAKRRRRWPLVVALVLLAVVALLVNAWIVTGRTRPAAARDGGDIVYTDVLEANVKVEGTGPPILLVHGFSAALDWWDGIAPELANTHRVIRLDLIGHGGTAAPPTGYSIEHQAELVASVLRKLKVDGVTAIGHSMGGEVVTALAEANPGLVERIILIDTPPVPEAHFDLASRLALMPVIGPLFADFATENTLRSGLAQGFAPGFPVPEKFVADMRQLTYNAFRSAHDDSVAFVTTKPTVERLAALTPAPPLLVIFGALDTLVPVDSAKIYGRVPGARVEMVDGAGHSPMVEKPAETLRLIEGFLPRVP